MERLASSPVVAFYMDPRVKIVTHLPLTHLWNADGDLHARPVTRIGRDEIVGLLNRHDVSFVVADVGHTLRWIANTEIYTFWKNEVQSRLVDRTANSLHLRAYPEEFCYIATEWKLSDRSAVVVLEKT